MLSPLKILILLDFFLSISFDNQTSFGKNEKREEKTNQTQQLFVVGRQFVDCGDWRWTYWDYIMQLWISFFFGLVIIINIIIAIGR